MREAVIIAAARTPCGKANKGSLRHTRPDTLGGEVIKSLLERVPKVEPHWIDDVLMGCAFPEASQGLNVARQAAILGGLPVEVSASTVNRFCASGLQTIAQAADRIMAGNDEIIIAGGVESMSLVPMGGYAVHPNPELVANYPDVYVNMGITAENVAEKYQISRSDMDAFALESHKRALNAWEQGYFDEQIVPVPVTNKGIAASGEVQEEHFEFRQDEGPRPDSSLEKLAGLKPVFKKGGTVTAGNSSQMNDAAAGVLVMSRERADKLGLKPMARYVSYATAGVAPELMGIGPVKAVPKALDKAGLKLDDIDLTELNEAFAAQALAVINELELDRESVNVNGGAIAMGHPLGCTGAKLTSQILHEMNRTQTQYSMVTMCVGGGMGAAGIFENVS